MQRHKTAEKGMRCMAHDAGFAVRPLRDERQMASLSSDLCFLAVLYVFVFKKLGAEFYFRPSSL